MFGPDNKNVVQLTEFLFENICYVDFNFISVLSRSWNEPFTRY